MALVTWYGDDSATPGMIYRSVSQYLPQLPDHLRSLNENVLIADAEAVDIERWYVGGSGLLIERPVMPILVTKDWVRADGHDMAVLSGIPKGSFLIMDDESSVMEDSSLEIASDLPAVYNIRFKKWPYLDWAVSIRSVTP